MPYNMLICTVGGSEQPIIVSIDHWKPEKIIFVCSKSSRSMVEEKILPDPRIQQLNITPGRYECITVENEQLLEQCVKDMDPVVTKAQEWIARGENHKVIIDFTGGTKCMSVALGLQMHRFPCSISYVGGSLRSKEGLGVVATGYEQLFDTFNPWLARGYHALEDIVTLFNQGHYGAAHQLACEWYNRAKQENVPQPEQQRIKALAQLIEGYHAWDQFQHAKAFGKLHSALGSIDNIRTLLREETASDTLQKTLQRHVDYLDGLKDVSNQVTRELIIDLMANAKRRKEEGRYDDAVARLYRATEALAQWRLAEQYGIPRTGEVSLEQLPPDLAEKWKPSAEDGKLPLGLQKAYELLYELGRQQDPEHGDVLAEQFRALNWHDIKKSALTGRNSSILAHGFAPVSERTFEQLWEGVLKLAETMGIKEDELPEFPKLGTLTAVT